MLWVSSITLLFSHHIFSSIYQLYQKASQYTSIGELKATVKAVMLSIVVTGGLNKKIFTMYKFRTMTGVKDENGELLPDSVRLTNFVEFLRSTSLDELSIYHYITILKKDVMKKEQVYLVWHRLVAEMRLVGRVNLLSMFSMLRM